MSIPNGKKGQNEVSIDKQGARPPAAGPVNPPGPIGGPVLPSFTKDLRDVNVARAAALHDLMVQIEAQFPPPGQMETTDVAHVVPTRRGTRKWLVVLAVIVTLLGGAIPVLTRSEPVRTLPPEVLGEWISASPRYAGRRLVLSVDRVRIEFGNGAAVLNFPISEVRTRVTSESVAYQVFYRQDGGLTQFLFSFIKSTSPPSIQLPNPEGIDWIRAKDVEALRERGRVANPARSGG